MTLKATEFVNHVHQSKCESNDYNDKNNKNESKNKDKSDRGVMDEEDWSKLTIKERIRVMKLDAYKFNSCASDSSRSNSNVQNEDYTNKEDMNQDELNQEDKVSAISVKERVQAIDIDKDLSLSSRNFDQTLKPQRVVNNSSLRSLSKSLPKNSGATERLSGKMKLPNSKKMDKNIESDAYDFCENERNKIMDSKKNQSTEETSPCSNSSGQNEPIHKEDPSPTLGFSTRHRIMNRRFNTKLATTTLSSACLKISEERRDANAAMKEVEDELVQSRVSSSQSNSSTHAATLTTPSIDPSNKTENANQNSTGQRFISFSPARRRALFQTAKTASSSSKQNHQPQQLSPIKSEGNRKNERLKSVNSIIPRPNNNKRRLTMNQKLQNIKKFNNKDIESPLIYNQILETSDERENKKVERRAKNSYFEKRKENFLPNGSLYEMDLNSITKKPQNTNDENESLTNLRSNNDFSNQFNLNHVHPNRIKLPKKKAERNLDLNNLHTLPKTSNAHEDYAPFHVDTSLINKSGETVSRVNDEDMIVEGPLFDIDDSIHHYEPFISCPDINNNNFHCNAFSSIHTPVPNQSCGKSIFPVYIANEKRNSTPSPSSPPLLIRSSQREIMIKTMHLYSTCHENMTYFSMNDKSRGSDDSPSSIPHKVEKSHKLKPTLANNPAISVGQVTSDDTRSPNQDKSFDNFVQTSFRELVETRVPKALSKDSTDTERMSNVTMDTISGRNDFRNRLKKGIWCKTDGRKGNDSSHIDESDYGEISLSSQDEISFEREYNQESASETRNEESPETCTAHIFNMIDGMCMHFGRKSASHKNCHNHMKKGKKSRLMQLPSIVLDSENDMKQTHSSGPSPRSLHDFEYLNHSKERINIGIRSRRERTLSSSRDLNDRFDDVKGLRQSRSRSKVGFMEIQ